MEREYFRNHMWGDKNFDWVGLEEAIDFLCDELYSRGRLDCYGKEKFGQARIHINFWDGCFSYFLPGKVKKYHKLYAFEMVYLSGLWLRLFGNLIDKKQKEAVLLAYRETCYRYPHLIEEILGGSSYPELLMDLFIELGLPSPWTNDKCTAGSHTPSIKEYGDEKYCSKCFKCISDIKDLGD